MKPAWVRVNDSGRKLTGPSDLRRQTLRYCIHMTVLMGLLLALVPLTIAPGLLFYFDVTPKIVILLAGAAVALPCFALGKEARGRMFLTPFGILSAALWISLLVSTIWSVDPALSVGGTNWRRLGLVSWTAILALAYIAYAHFQGRPREILVVLRGITVSGTVVSAYGVLQFFGWDPWLPREAYHIGEGIWTIVRPPGTLGYVTYFAAYLLSVVFSGAALCLVEPSRCWKIWGAIAVSVAGTAIVLSGTRAAIIGLLAGTALLAIWLRPRFHVARTAVVVSIVLAGCVGFYVSPAGQKLRSRTRWYVEDPLGGPRLSLWQDSIRMSAAHWLKGAGPETFSSEFPRFQSAELSRQAPDFYHESPHNVFLDVLTSQGVLALGIFVFLLASAFRGAKRASINEPRLAPALGAALLASLTAHQFGCLTAPTAFFLFMQMALAGALGATSAPYSTALRPRLPRYALLLSCSIFAAGFGMFATRLLVADRMLAVADSALRSGDLRAAFSSYERAIRWAPSGMNADLWYSRRLIVIMASTPDIRLRWEAWNRAFSAGSRAAQVSEDKHNAWYNLATLSATREDASATERNLRSAIGVAPRWYKPHWMLAETLRVTGRLDEAEVEASLACDLNGGKNAEVTRTREAIRSLRTAR